MTDILQSQDAALKLLADPATHGGKPVRRIDTHAGIVFLAGDRALKVKRAVRFPFLDYSTLEKRKAACEAEIEVNQPFASSLYRGVVALTRDRAGSLQLDGRGEPVEWAVEMRRFDENRTLDLVATDGGIGLDLAEELARVVAAAHARAPVVAAAPWIAAIETFIGQNETAFAEAPDLFPPEAVARLTHASRAALDRVRPILALRGDKGLVRRGHGDLHLGNIAMIDGRPMAFDAIEFDPLIAAGDVLYDLAFLLMDLIERGLGAAANVVFNRYLVDSGAVDDVDGLAALPLFLSLRAAIRAKVTAARRAFVSDHLGLAAAAQSYFRLALSFISPPAPMLVAIGGLSGTGKSATARCVAPRLPPAPGALVLRSDVERKRMWSVAETDRLPTQAYEAEVTAQVYGALAATAARVLAAGHSVIVDAVFARAQERAQIEAVARTAGVAFRGAFLVADLPIRIARIGARGADASDADAAVARRQEEFELGALNWARIDASGSPGDTLAAVMELVPGAADSHAPGSAGQGKSIGCAARPDGA